MSIQENISLKSFNSFAIDVKARYFSTISTAEELIELSAYAKKKSIPILILGEGSNILFRKNYAGLVIKTNFLGISPATTKDGTVKITAAAGENWHQFVQYTLHQGHYGLENLTLIPGSVGAAPIQNIGAYGVELAEKIHSLNAIDMHSRTPTPILFSNDQCEFSYRNSYFKKNAGRYIITDVTFNLPQRYEFKINYPGINEYLGGQQPDPVRISEAILKLRQSKLPNPDLIANAGSFFKNPIINKPELDLIRQDYPDIVSFPATGSAVKLSAAWLIDQCGWKGFRQGDAGVSETHALILVNYGSATGHNIWTLATKIIDSVHEKFKIRLQPEPLIV